MVLFCPVVLPGFLYLVIFLSLFSLIIILITWSLPIYSVPCLVQVFIALPFPCFFVLSHVVLSVFFRLICLSGFIKRLCLFDLCLLRFLPNKPWHLLNHIFIGLCNHSFTWISGIIVLLDSGIPVLLDSLEKQFIEIIVIMYIFLDYSLTGIIFYLITVLLDSLEPQFYWTLWNHSFTGLSGTAVLLDTLETAVLLDSLEPQIYWTLWNRSFTGLSGTAVLLDSLESQFYWTLWNRCFMTLWNHSLLDSLESQFYWTLWNHSFIGLSGTTVLFESLERSFTGLSAITVLLDSWIIVLLDSLEPQFYWSIWNHSFTGLFETTVLLDSLESQFYWTLWNRSFTGLSGITVVLDSLKPQFY